MSGEAGRAARRMRGGAERGSGFKTLDLEHENFLIQSATTLVRMKSMLLKHIGQLLLWFTDVHSPAVCQEQT